MFNKIYNPITKTNLDIKSKSGRDLLTKYIKQYFKLSKSNMKGGNIPDTYYRFGFEFEFAFMLHIEFGFGYEFDYELDS